MFLNRGILLGICILGIVTGGVLLYGSMQTVRFAVIGDYGVDTPAEFEVSRLVHQLEPDLILTVGDNNCPNGMADTIDRNVGQYYQDYIYPYSGRYGPGARENRFFPVLGNHDLNSGDISAYLDYFTLPCNERYYDFVQGPVHFFALDSLGNEPDGFKSTSVQAEWLQKRLAQAQEPWKIVYLHVSPYSSGAEHGSAKYMQWPFAEWGADAVISGHDHLYERLLINGTPYIVDGLGGDYIYNFADPLPESRVRYNGNHGAMLVTADRHTLTFQLYSIDGTLVDEYSISS